MAAGRRLAAVTTVAACAAGLVVAAAPPAGAGADTHATVGHRSGGVVHFHPGAAGVGDRYFPLLGNGGYNVSHYHLRLRYRPARHFLSGTVTITARATTNLSRFDLDLKGMTVHGVRVNGAPAVYTRPGPELRITPPHGLRKGHTFVTAVTYGGRPKTITGSPLLFGAAYGWQYTKDGSFVGDEPNGARTWFPCNDHPSDKASYRFAITVPGNRSVVANGELIGGSAGGGSGGGPGVATEVWSEKKPMATYLATVGIGRWRFHQGRTPAGIAELVAFDPKDAKTIRRAHIFRLAGRITDYWAKKFGRYPFTSTGAIVDDLPGVGFSIETQTRPLYGFVPNGDLMAHELSHQWFGDSVSVSRWRDIWLNEGFATFAEWLWAQHTGGPSAYSIARQQYRQYKAKARFWHQRVADPKRDTMFSAAVYVRGGMTLAALEHRIGSADLFRLFHRWTARHRYGNGNTGEFVHLAEQVSGQHLHRFFRIWLRTERKPRSFDAG